MSTAVVNPVPGPAAHGATALRDDAEGHPRHLLGNALRAVKVFAATAFSVVVLGEYGEEMHPAR
ncbi:hypothetical protein [Streptomyces sp. NPDC018031]|uniref:hypothetical protein n=1 Tax=Streptomyces sp. NPDC018031 TaxID=3365033 RepID=UPI0037B998A6